MCTDFMPEIKTRPEALLYSVDPYIIMNLLRHQCTDVTSSNHKTINSEITLHYKFPSEVCFNTVGEKAIHTIKKCKQILTLSWG